jgi:hypothetical protein
MNQSQHQSVQNVQDKKAKKSKKQEEQVQQDTSDKLGFDWIRILVGILVLSVLLVLSLDMINDQFADKQDELIEEKQAHVGWVVIVLGYTVPLALACVVPVAVCIGSKKTPKIKHLVKLLVVVGAAVVIFAVICPVRISDLVEQRELSEAYEKIQEGEKDKEETTPMKEMPSVKEVTLDLQRVAEWTAKAGIAIAVVGPYHGVRYKKFKDGEEDEEVPPEESCDDLPDVDWVPSPKEAKKS